MREICEVVKGGLRKKGRKKGREMIWGMDGERGVGRGDAGGAGPTSRGFAADGATLATLPWVVGCVCVGGAGRACAWVGAGGQGYAWAWDG